VPESRPVDHNRAVKSASILIDFESGMVHNRDEEFILRVANWGLAGLKKED
jgi:hypothetical protein